MRLCHLHVLLTQESIPVNTEQVSKIVSGFISAALVSIMQSNVYRLQFSVEKVGSSTMLFRHANRINAYKIIDQCQAHPLYIPVILMNRK